jgi:hypothetical protein
MNGDGSSSNAQRNYFLSLVCHFSRFVAQKIFGELLLHLSVVLRALAPDQSITALFSSAGSFQ